MCSSLHDVGVALRPTAAGKNAHAVGHCTLVVLRQGPRQWAMGKHGCHRFLTVLNASLVHQFVPNGKHVIWHVTNLASRKDLQLQFLIRSCRRLMQRTALLPHCPFLFLKVMQIKFFGCPKSIANGATCAVLRHHGSGLGPLIALIALPIGAGLDRAIISVNERMACAAVRD